MELFKKAPRLLAAPWRHVARGALVIGILWGASQAAAEIVSADYVNPTDHYPHGVLGDPSEYTTLVITTSDGARHSLTWDRPLVFEDTAPRLIDVTGDGLPEVITVQSHEQMGAQFAIYEFRDGQLSAYASNPFIGTRFRWLAIVGVADLDGDGALELAYVDRPHLARTLRIWRITPLGPGSARLEQVGEFAGVTNHRIGEVDIAGGIRDCGSGPEMIVADARWQRLLSLRWDGANVTAADIGTHRGRASFATAMAC